MLRKHFGLAVRRGEPIIMPLDDDMPDNEETILLRAILHNTCDIRDALGGFLDDISGQAVVEIQTDKLVKASMTEEFDTLLQHIDEFA